MQPTKLFRFCILILPFLFLWGGLTIHIAKYGNDPNYVYLANAAVICDGQSVGYHDHPGTTVMQIGAFTIAVKHWLNNPDNLDIVTHVVNDPVLFMDAIQRVLVILNFIVLLLLGFISLKLTGSVWAALLFQLTAFLSSNTLDHIWTKVEPEPLLFFITCIYVITILYFYNSGHKNKLKYVVIFSLITGAGLATKATFLPLIVLPLLILPKFKNKLLFFAGVLLSFVLFTIPLIPEYKYMYFWFKDLTSHTGKYGHGEKGIIDFSTYFPNLLELLKNNLIFSVVTGIGIIAFFVEFLRKKQINWELKILGGLLLSCILGILIVSKHYMVHPDHYLIPELMLIGIIIFFTLKLIKPGKHILPLVVIGLTILLAFKIPDKMKYIDYGYRITNEELDSTQKILDSDYSEYTKIYYYPYSFNKYSALNFGDVYSKHKLLPYLKREYPKVYFYNFIHNVFQYWSAELTLQDIIEFNGNKILLVGGPRDKNELQNLEDKGFPLKEIYSGRVQMIYELDTLKYKKKSGKKSEEIIDFCSFEGKADEKDFGNIKTRSDDFARSGNSSLKVDAKTEFAVEYYLDSLKQGEYYEIDIWRKAENHSARIVIGSVEPNVFYQSQNDFIDYDGSGWKLLRLRFRVTAELDNKALKIYIWNKDKKTAYFDDLTIKRILFLPSGSNNLNALGK